MKCVRLRNEQVVRVSDDQALHLVKNEGAKYVPKSVWKREVRDKKKPYSQKRKERKAEEHEILQQRRT